MSEVQSKIIAMLKSKHCDHLATWIIAGKLGVKTSVARYHLKKLESKGEILRNERYGDCNNIVWEIKS